MHHASPAEDERPGFELTGASDDLTAARRWTRDMLPGITDDEVEDIQLIVTELVSNAFDHGTRPYALRLHRSSAQCFVRVEVDDASPELPVLGTSRLGEFRGRGMIIVDQLAKNWGVTQHADTGHKTVWAAITCEGRR